MRVAVSNSSPPQTLPVLHTPFRYHNFHLRGVYRNPTYPILSYRRPTGGEPCGSENRLAAQELPPKPTANGTLWSIPPSGYPAVPDSTGPGRTPRSKYSIRRLPLAVGIKHSTSRMTRMVGLMRGANRDTILDRPTRPTWIGRLEKVPYPSFAE